MSVFSAYRVSAYSRFTVSSRCACVLQFRQGVSLARPGSFPIRQLTGKRSRLVIMGITLAMLFSQAPVRIVFYRIAIFISERTRAQLWHYFIASLFHTTLALPKLRALRVRTKNTFLDRSNLLHWFVVPRGVVI